MDVAPLSTFQIFYLPYDIRCVAAAELKNMPTCTRFKPAACDMLGHLLAYTSVRGVVQ